jgi:hypothetical protein
MSNEINLREALTVARESLLVPWDAGCSLLARHAAGWGSDDTAVLVLRVPPP